MNDRQSTLSILPILVALCFISLFLQSACWTESLGDTTSLESLAYGSMTAICLASKHHMQLTNFEFFVLSAAPMVILAEFAALMMLMSTTFIQH